VKDILVTAPDPLRAKYRGMTSPALMAALEKTRPAGAPSEPLSSTMRCLKRYVAREIYDQLFHPHPAPDGGPLRT
ncbi:hypothetical protein LD110_23505, partial [Arthrobacter sp. M4]|nr:hypothetical protein [Arthrobacter sp. M4]